MKKEPGFLPLASLRALRQTLPGVLLTVLASACVFGPDVEGLVKIDHPPFIDPNAIVPSPTDEALVSFNLSLAARTRPFQAQGVYDYDAGDVLTHAWVVRMGNGTPISWPPVNQPLLTMGISQNQNIAFATRYESASLPFDPCTYPDVRDGLADFGTIQLIVYDRIESVPRTDFTQEYYTAIWTWPLEFTGQCPICSSPVDCFEGEICQGGVCVAQ